MMHPKDFFFCYNPKLSKFLYERGFRYIVKAANVETNRIFTLYAKSYGLSEAIDEYKSLKK